MNNLEMKKLVREPFNIPDTKNNLGILINIQNEYFDDELLVDKKNQMI